LLLLKLLQLMQRRFSNWVASSNFSGIACCAVVWQRPSLSQQHCPSSRQWLISAHQSCISCPDCILFCFSFLALASGEDTKNTSCSVFLSAVRTRGVCVCVCVCMCE
jgi:hypothetical protein